MSDYKLNMEKAWTTVIFQGPISWLMYKQLEHSVKTLAKLFLPNSSW